MSVKSHFLKNSGKSLLSPEFLSADLVTFTEEILNGKLHIFFSSETWFCRRKVAEDNNTEKKKKNTLYLIALKS